MTATVQSAGLMLGVLGPTHYVLIALAILLLFGGKKLPELARGLAKGLRIFKAELHGVQKDLEGTLDEDATEATKQKVTPPPPPASCSGPAPQPPKQDEPKA